MRVVVETISKQLSGVSVEGAGAAQIHYEEVDPVLAGRVLEGTRQVLDRQNAEERSLTIAPKPAEPPEVTGPAPDVAAKRFRSLVGKMVTNGVRITIRATEWVATVFGLS